MSKRKIEIEINEEWLSLKLTDEDGAKNETYHKSLNECVNYATKWFKDIKKRRVTYKTLQAMYNNNR